MDFLEYIPAKWEKGTAILFGSNKHDPTQLLLIKNLAPLLLMVQVLGKNVIFEYRENTRIDFDEARTN